MFRKTVEVETRITRGYTSYYLVTRWYFLGILVYTTDERKS